MLADLSVALVLSPMQLGAYLQKSEIYFNDDGICWSVLELNASYPRELRVD
jgi:hypothetical protein